MQVIAHQVSYTIRASLAATDFLQTQDPPLPEKYNEMLNPMLHTMDTPIYQASQ